jgi:hypothetical protein
MSDRDKDAEILALRHQMLAPSSQCWSTVADMARFGTMHLACKVLCVPALGVGLVWRTTAAADRRLELGLQVAHPDLFASRVSGP